MTRHSKAEEPKFGLGQSVRFRKGDTEQAGFVTAVIDGDSADVTVFTGNVANPVAVKKGAKLVEADGKGTGFYLPA